MNDKKCSSCGAWKINYGISKPLYLCPNQECPMKTYANEQWDSGYYGEEHDYD